jgi:hypothetical protein
MFFYVISGTAIFQVFCDSKENVSSTTHKMKSGLCFSAITLLLSYGLGVMAQSLIVRPPLTEDPVVYTCENVTQIEFCSKVGYTTASFPNYRDQPSQTNASSELENFRALASNVCSNAIVHFLCSVYAPFCDPRRPDIRVPPCRELCEYVRVGCEPPVVQYGLSWPPHLECSLYPARNSASSLITFCPPDISTLSIPSNIETNPPPNTTEPTEPATTTIAAATAQIVTTVVTSTDTTVICRSLHLSPSIYLYFVSLCLTLFLPCILTTSSAHA